MTKEEELSLLLSALSSEKARELALALEREKVKSGAGALPVESLLAKLRPKLRELEAGENERIPTPLRVFVQAFEGLIVDVAGQDKRRARVERQSIVPIWNWLVSKTGGDLGAEADALKKAILSGDPDQIFAAARELDTAACAKIEAANKTAAVEGKLAKQLKDALGGKRAVDDLSEIVLALNLSEDTRQMRAQLPAEIDVGSTEFSELIDKYYQAALAHGGDPSYLILSIAPRLPKPWNVLGLAARLVEADDDKDLQQSPLSLVGERIIDDIELNAQAIANLRPSEFDPEFAIERLRIFAHFQKGVTQELGLLKDGDWGKRLLAARRIVSGALEELFDRSANDIEGLLRTRKAPRGFKGGSRTADVSRIPSGDAVKRAVGLAQFIADARDFASQLGYAVAHDKVRTDVTNAIDAYASMLVEVMVHGQSEEEAAISAHVEACEKVMRPLFSEEAIDLFTRRIVSARNKRRAAG